MDLSANDIFWNYKDPQTSRQYGIVLLNNCNAVFFSGKQRSLIYEAYAPYSEAIFGYAPYQEGALSNWPIPEIYEAATNPISAMIGNRGDARSLVEFINWVATFEKRIEMEVGEVLAANVLGHNENFYSVTQVGKKPVDFKTGQLIDLDTSDFDGHYPTGFQ